MQIICLTLLLCLSSCALFKQSPSLHDKDPQELLKAVKITGEGKGRLSLGMNQYVFSVDSVLQDRDWILAVSIPLHGEEVMIFRNLKHKVLQDSETESFEERIRLEFKHRKLDKVIPPERFLSELRSMVRFILASELNLTSHCDAHNSTYVCELEGEKFTISVTEKKFLIHKMLKNGHKLELVAQNLTDSFFLKNDFHLYVDKKEIPQKPAFSLELFW